MPYRICIVGAGVIGSSVAYCLVNNVPEADVTVIAENFTPDTTSDVAAGLWMPYRLNNTPTELTSRWGGRTRDFLLHLMSKGITGIGLQIISGYMLDNDNKYDSSASSFLRYSDLTERESRLFSQNRSHPHFVTSVMCEGTKYVPWMLQNAKEKGARLMKRRIDTLDELFGKFDVVINCSGNGAGNLVKDKDFYVERGHALKVEAPWIKHFYGLDDWNFYIIPGVNDVTLGSTHEKNDYSLEPRESDAQAIFEACCNIVPSLKNAKIIKHVVGLRPCRKAVRLEEELITHNGKITQVIHNYGHGGAGLTLHYGCAEDVVSLVRKRLKKSKL